MVLTGFESLVRVLEMKGCIHSNNILLDVHHPCMLSMDIILYTYISELREREEQESMPSIEVQATCSMYNRTE